MHLVGEPSDGMTLREATLSPLHLQNGGDDAAARSKRLCSLLTRVLKDAEDLQLIEQGSQCLGKLVKQYADVSSELVEAQVHPIRAPYHAANQQCTSVLVVQPRPLFPDPQRSSACGYVTT